MSFLVERPFILTAVWLAAQFMLVWIWSSRRDRASARGVWIGLIALPLLQAVAFVVDTPRERVIATCRGAADAIDEGRMDVLAEHLAGEFTVIGLDKSEFLARVEQTLSQVRVDRPRLRAFSVDFPKEGEAVAEFSASARIRAPRMFAAIPSKWRLEFRQQDGVWRITGAKSIPVPPLHVSDLRQWLQ